MQTRAWYQSAITVCIAALVFPPLGFVLLWLRPQTGIIRKLAGSFAIALLGIAHLFLVYGLRVEMAGSGLPGFVTFSDPESHAEAVERDRAEQTQASPPPTPVPSAGEREPTAEAATQPSASDFAPRAHSPGADSRYWTDFRGPRRDGHYDQIKIRTAWPSEGLPLLWRQPVGGGYASFTIADGRAFTIEQRRDREVVAAYDIQTGRELWTHSWEAYFHETLGGDGPRTTPTWAEGRIYALGATGELRCLDAETGQRIWSRNILDDNGARNLTWGMAASPLVVDDKVIVLPGGSDGRSIVAYNKSTGEAIWKSLDDQQAYTSPMLVTLAGLRQILVVSAERAMGVNIGDGSLLWEYPWATYQGINAAQPIFVDENHVFLSAGYGHGATLLEITRTGESFAVDTVWENINMKNRFTSSVLFQGHIYGLDQAILACIDARTGNRKWKGGRYGYGQVVLASGHLIVLTETGDLVLVRATPDGHQELARFSALDGKTWNHPALADGYLLVRNEREMAAFQVSQP